MSNKKTEKSSALKKPSGVDRDWQKKIEIAKAAREQGQRQRAGKPGSFRSALGRSH